MKKLLMVIAGALLGTLVLAACGSSSSAVQKLDPKSFGEGASKPGVVLLDVRTPEEFAAGHLAGATNINAEDPGFGAALASLDKDASYAVYCQSGRRSAIATAKMAEAGFANVVELEGGTKAWEQAGGQFTTG